MGRGSVGTATLAVLLAGLGAPPASALTNLRQPASAHRAEATAESYAEPAGPPAGSPAEDRIATIRPEALVTTATVLALAMGATGVVTGIRARRRARE